MNIILTEFSKIERELIELSMSEDNHFFALDDNVHCPLTVAKYRSSLIDELTKHRMLLFNIFCNLY